MEVHIGLRLRSAIAFPFSKYFHNHARLFLGNGILTFPTVFTAITFTPPTGTPFFSSFHVLFRRLSCYGRVSLRSRLLKGSFNYLCLPSIIQCTTKDFPENS